MKKSYVILSLCLIAVGLFALYYCLTFIFSSSSVGEGAFSFFSLITIIPLAVILPLAGGILCLRDQLKNRRK